jgi:hypothetical protein
MANKKQFIFVFIFLLVGICAAAAQDLIVLKDGNMIEAKVIEISPTEIRYKRSDNLDGPTIVIPADRVLSIKYKNGTQEIINAAPAPAAAPEQKKTQPKPANTATAMDPDKFIFAMNANLGGFLSLGGYGGPSLCFEFGKRYFNSEVHLFFPMNGRSRFEEPPTGFGGIATFNWFKPNSVGGFYLGGGVGYILLTYVYNTSFGTFRYDENIFTVGLNIGWKFVTRSGVYFRTGTYLGITITDNEYMDSSASFPYLKPDLAIGYCFK